MVQTSAALPGLLQADETLPGPGPWPLTARAAGPAGLVSVGGVPLRQLAAEYGTPANIVDERDLRQRARDYRAAFGDGAGAYAAEAFLCRFMARCADEEGLALGLRSAGELAVAASAGFPAARIIVRGQAKTPEDVRPGFVQVDRRRNEPPERSPQTLLLGSPEFARRFEPPEAPQVR